MRLSSKGSDEGKTNELKGAPASKEKLSSVLLYLNPMM